MRQFSAVINARADVQNQLRQNEVQLAAEQTHERVEKNMKAAQIYQ